MKKFKQFDLIISIAFFISFCFIITTVIIQSDIKKELTVFKYENKETIAMCSNNEQVASKIESVQQTEITTEICSQESNLKNVSDVNLTKATTTQNKNNYNNETIKNNSETPDKVNVTENKETKAPKTTKEKSTELDSQFVVNKNTKTIHSTTCSSAKRMKDENKIIISSDELQSYLDNGYKMCNICHGYRE